MNMFHPHYIDPFSPSLLSSPALNVTQEQKDAIQDVLDIASSDSFFAKKAYAAISLILTGGSVSVPTVTSLTPNSAELGDPSFTLHVHGTKFDSSSIIVFAGFEEPTTFISPTEVTTGVDMSVWHGPDAVPVGVVNSNGILSDTMMFTFVDGSIPTATIGMGQLIPGPTMHSAPSHPSYAPISVPDTELKEHHSIKSAKEEAAKKESEKKTDEGKK